MHQATQGLRVAKQGQGAAKQSLGQAKQRIWTTIAHKTDVQKCIWTAQA